MRAAILTVIGVVTTGIDVAAETSRPNIIFFLSDDHRADFLGCAGHPILKTPVIDRLAKEGVRFENAFVTTSICAASRATLFTGLWERTHKYTFGAPPISAEHVAISYPLQLRSQGYRTGFIGKFGVNVGRGGTDKMFDQFTPLNRNPYFKKQADGSLRHLTDITGDHAIDFLKNCRDNQPFCLSVSFNASHAEDSDKENHFPWPHAIDGFYDDVTIPPPIVSTEHWKSLPQFLKDSIHRDRWFWRWDTPEKYQNNVKAYYRMITGLDRVVGLVLREAERLGFGDNTVVIFCGDNGYYKGSRGFAGKWSHFEESLRVPLVIYDPRIPQNQRGKVVSEMALNVDVPATIMTLATGAAPPMYQGRDLTVLTSRNAPTNWRTDFFCEHLMNHPRIPKWEGVRGSRYVYARYFENMPNGEFLHDLKQDPKQLVNLVSDPSAAKVLSSMRSRCDELRDSLGGAYSREKFPSVRRGGSAKKSKKSKG